MVGPAFGPGHDVVNGEVAKQEAHQADRTPAFLPAEEGVLLRLVGRYLAQVGAQGDVPAMVDIVTAPSLCRS